MTEESSAFDWLGYTMDAAGDVDGDGWMDVFVGIPRYNPSGAAWPNGAVGVYSGFDGSRLNLVVGPTFSSIGYALRTAGDVDGDSVVDFVVGGYPQDLIRVHSGKTGALLAEFTGGVIDDQFGWSVDVAGDVDADGELDFIGGGPIYQTAGGLHQIGSCRIVSAQTGADLHVHHGATQTAHLGWSVAGVGDVDQDGFDDYGVGIPGDPTGGGFAAGAVEVRSGSTGGVLHHLTGDAPGERLGTLVRRVGDVDVDGVADFVAGGFGAINTIHDQVRVLSGADAQEILRLKKKLPEARIWSAAPFGDWDGDGSDEILVTYEEPLSKEPSGVLTVSIVNGSGSTLANRSGPFDDRFGFACAAIGDVNGNGLDLAVGSYLAPGSGKLSILSSTLGTITKIGAPCQSSLGADAYIDLEGTPTPGGEVSLFALSGEFEPTVAALFLGATGAAIPVGNGCSLYVGPPHVVLFLPTDEFGRIDYAFDTPVTFPVGAIHVQAFFADAKTPVGFTATAGRVIDFQ
ncbi:MAG: integrin alpha [Planctomycetota bacterium JB042]